MTPAGCIILVTLAVWVAFDVAAYLRGWETESTWVRAVSKRPGVPFACGVLAGHWFF